MHFCRLTPLKNVGPRMALRFTFHRRRVMRYCDNWIAKLVVPVWTDQILFSVGPVVKTINKHPRHMSSQQAGRSCYITMLAFFTTGPHCSIFSLIRLLSS